MDAAESLLVERAMDLTQEVLFAFTADGEMLQWNRRVNDETGYSDEEIAEMHPIQFVPSEEAGRVERQIETVLENGCTEFESLFQTKEGREIPYEFTGALVEWDGEKLICGAGRNIAGRQQVHEERESSEICYRRLFEEAQEGIAVTTPDGEIREVNPAAARIFGYSREELQSMNAVRLYADAAQREAIAAELQDKGRITAREIRLRRSDGEEIICELSAALQHEKEGAQLWQGFFRDVTELRELQREILQVQEKERKRLGQDLHDGIASQLTGVKIMLSNLARTAEREETSGEELAERIRKLQRLVGESTDEVRRLSRGLNPAGLSEGGLPMALARLAANMKEGRFVVADQAGDEGEQVEVETEDDVPELDVFPELEGDTAAHLYWITQEAITNARKYADADDIVIYLGMGEDTLALFVEDDGRGFVPSEVDDKGLGLRSMRHRAELLGATFSVNSVPGEGTSISCRLPMGSW